MSLEKEPDGLISIECGPLMQILSIYCQRIERLENRVEELETKERRRLDDHK